MSTPSCSPNVVATHQEKKDEMVGCQRFGEMHKIHMHGVVAFTTKKKGEGRGQGPVVQARSLDGWLMISFKN